MNDSIREIAVVGGSHAGLFAAIALQNAGFRVRVFERAPEVLRGTGAGIRVQPLLADILQREAQIDLDAFATRTRYDRHLAPRAAASVAGAGNKIVFEQIEAGSFASWGSLYRALLARFGAADYHCGASCIDSREVGGKIELQFAGGRVETVDFAVFADGIASPARQRLHPTAREQYAGYVAWRGLVPEAQLSAATRALLHEARLFVIPGLSHVILYPVPGEAGLGGEGGRLINAIWYRNVAAGAAIDDLMTDRGGTRRPNSLKAGTLQARHLDEFRRAVEAELPPAAVEVFSLCDPFITTINDVEPARMAFGRQVLIGDAAAATRPHVSASTARALRAAWGLADALQRARDGADLATSLAAWESEHVAIAREFTARGRLLGRRLQVEGSFVPGAPEMSQITMPASR